QPVIEERPLLGDSGVTVRHPVRLRKYQLFVFQWRTGPDKLLTGTALVNIPIGCCGHLGPLRNHRLTYVRIHPKRARWSINGRIVKAPLRPPKLVVILLAHAAHFTGASVPPSFREPLVVNTADVDHVFKVFEIAGERHHRLEMRRLQTGHRGLVPAGIGVAIGPDIPAGPRLHARPLDGIIIIFRFLVTERVLLSRAIASAAAVYSHRRIAVGDKVYRIGALMIFVPVIPWIAREELVLYLFMSFIVCRIADASTKRLLAVDTQSHYHRVLFVVVRTVDIRIQKRAIPHRNLNVLYLDDAANVPAYLVAGRCGRTQPPGSVGGKHSAGLIIQLPQQLMDFPRPPRFRKLRFADVEIDAPIADDLVRFRRNRHSIFHNAILVQALDESRHVGQSVSIHFSNVASDVWIQVGQGYPVRALPVSQYNTTNRKHHHLPVSALKLSLFVSYTGEGGRLILQPNHRTCEHTGPNLSALLLSLGRSGHQQ